MWSAPDLLRLETVNSGPALSLTFRPPVPAGMRVAAVRASAPARLVHTAGGDEIQVSCPRGATRMQLDIAMR